MTPLRALAETVGLVTRFQSTTGGWVEPPEEDLLATLQAYGVEIVSAEDADRVHEAVVEARRARALPPVVVAWDGRLPAVPLGEDADRGLTGVVLCEDGRRIELDLVDGALVARQRLPFGRHRLELGEAASAVFSAPTMAWRPAAGEERRWGIFVPTYALRTGHTRGIGDLDDLAAAFDWLDRRGGQVVVTLPMLATFLDPPAQFSPYAPVSRRFWNELFCSVADLPGADRLGEPGGDLVDYDRAWAERRPIVAAAAEAFFGSGGSPAFDAWLTADPLVETYARFRAAGERHGRNWRAWPGGGDLPDDVDPATVRFHLYAQWRTDTQLAALRQRVTGRGQLLALDLPLGSHPDGFDVWRERDLFAAGVSAGAPPDSFFSLGQDWGFPPVHPERSREEGHAYWQASIRHHLRHAGLLRIDHILGLLRLYWVRQDAGPKRGVYVRYPLEELLAVICLEASRVGAVVVGENLGTVPPEITAAMAEHGLLGCAVTQFDVWEAMKGRPIPAPPASSTATLNTHDTATFAAFWSGSDTEDRADLGLLDDEGVAEERRQRQWLRETVTHRLGLAGDVPVGEVLVGLIGVAAESDAALVVANVEDGWLQELPQNVPGTVEQRPNWRRRVAFPVEAWDDVAGLDGMVRRLEAARPTPPRPGRTG